MLMMMIIIIQFNSIPFFTYLRAELNSQWPITESARIQTTTVIRQHRTKQTKNNKGNNEKRKIYQLRLFTFKHDLLKVFVDLQIAFAAATHLAEGQWLKEQMNVVKLRLFRMPTVSRTEGKYLVPLKTFIKNNASN
jgi:hypothetical protein